MKSEMINKAARATLNGSMSFPEVVQTLMAAEVEYYHVDYVALQKTFYSATGEVVKTPITYEGLPAVAGHFERDTLRAVILESQNKGLHYKDFTQRAMTAGVQGYIVFLRGRRVIYWGRDGEQHIEFFPSSSA